MSEEQKFTAEELRRMADQLLEEADQKEAERSGSAKGKKKGGKKKPAAPELPVKTPEERLAELLEKGKKNGKLSAKELECLEEMNLDSEIIDKFYETLDANVGYL